MTENREQPRSNNKPQQSAIPKPPKPVQVPLQDLRKGLDMNKKIRTR